MDHDQIGIHLRGIGISHTDIWQLLSRQNERQQHHEDLIKSKNDLQNPTPLYNRSLG